jgi:hypothetical protein
MHAGQLLLQELLALVGYCPLLRKVIVNES